MAKKIIIHIGLAKTGTTSIQNFLFLNKHELLTRCGILCPLNPLEHYYLAALGSKFPQDQIQLRRAGKSTREAAEQFLGQWWAELQAEAQQHPEATLLFSTEYFPALTSNELLAVRQKLDLLATHYEIIAVIRDPWTFAISHTQQVIRDGLAAAPVHLSYQRGNIEVLDMVERAFGVEASVYEYLPSVRSNKGSVPLFLEHLGLPTDNWKSDPDQQNLNISITYETACLVASFNKHYSALLEDGTYLLDPARDWAVEALLGISNGRPITMPKGIAKEIYEQSYEDIAILQNRYFNGREIYWDYYRNLQLPDDNIVLDATLLAGDAAITALYEALYTLAARAIRIRSWASHLEAENVALRDKERR